MDSFLTVCFLFEIFRFKNVRNTGDDISGYRNGHMMRKDPSR